MAREEYLKAVKDAYCEARDKVFPYDAVRRRPLKTDIAAIAKAADMKIPCSLMLKVIKEEAPKYRARYPKNKIIPPFAYFLAIAEAQNRKAPLDPAGIRKDKTLQESEFIQAVRGNIEILKGIFTVPLAGEEALKNAASVLESLLEEAGKRKKAGGKWVSWLYESIVKIEDEFHREARQGLEAARDHIVWLRHCADACERLRRRGAELVTWDIIDEVFHFLSIPRRWTEKQK